MAIRKDDATASYFLKAIKKQIMIEDQSIILKVDGKDNYVAHNNDVVDLLGVYKKKDLSSLKIYLDNETVIFVHKNYPLYKWEIESWIIDKIPIN